MQKGSPETEEYLEAIYRKKEKGEKARTNDLAQEIRVSPASVSEMLSRLARKGLVRYEPYKSVRLTKKGEEIGKRITEKHRLIEKFLAFLGIRENIHEEACVLEHAVSDNIEKAIARLVREKDIRRISEMKKGDCGVVMLISAGAAAEKRLMEMGLTIGTRIRVERASTMMGPVEVRVRGSSLAIGRGLAQKVFVRKCG